MWNGFCAWCVHQRMERGMAKKNFTILIFLSRLLPPSANNSEKLKRCERIHVCLEFWRREENAHGVGGKTYKSFRNWKGNMLCEEIYTHKYVLDVHLRKTSLNFGHAIFSHPSYQSEWKGFERFGFGGLGVCHLKCHLCLVEHSLPVNHVRRIVSKISKCWQNPSSYLHHQRALCKEKNIKFCKKLLNIMEEYKMYWFFQQYFFVYVSFS